MGMTNSLHLSRAERVKEYLARAQAARIEASKSAGEAQAALMDVARQWEGLAQKVEQPIPRTPG
jgi:hypothetical protein